MGILEILDSVIFEITILTLIIYVAMNIYTSKYHLKVMDKIVYGQVHEEDNYIHKAMRIIDYTGYISNKRLRKRLPIEIQNEIMALDKKFHRLFIIQGWVLNFLTLIVVIIIILELFFPEPEL